MKAELRAGLLALVLLSQGLAAIPNPPKLAENALEDPTARAELDAWIGRVRMIGWEPTPAELLAFAEAWSERLRDTRSFVLAPFRPFLKATGTGQGWGLFAFPDRQPHRLEVHVLVQGKGFQPIYVDLDPEQAAYAGLFVNRRVRAIYNPGKAPAPAFKPMSLWLAREIFRDMPEVERVRFGFRKSRMLQPGEDHPGYGEKLNFVKNYPREER